MLRETLLAPGVLVLTRGGESLRESFGANAVALFGRNAVVLVDPLIAPCEARAVEEAVRAHTAAPLLAVVVTHHHTDHALGAGHFARHGVPVFASAACVAAMEAQHPAIVASRRADPALSDLFDGAEPYLPVRLGQDGVELDLGGATARLRLAGPAHTPGDVVVECPERSVLVAGDLVSNGYHVNYEEADPDGFEAALRRLADRPPRCVVPGHGAPGDASLVARCLKTHLECRAIVRGGAGLGAAAVAAHLAERWPAHLLRGVLPDTVRALSR